VEVISFPQKAENIACGEVKIRLRLVLSQSRSTFSFSSPALTSPREALELKELVVGAEPLEVREAQMESEAIEVQY
jgi:hypothetical protein